MNNKLEWIYGNGSLSADDIAYVEESLGVKYPKDYIDCVINHDGAYPIPDVFDLNGNGEVFNHLLSLKPDSNNGVIEAYGSVKDRMPDKIIPFAGDPFGNLICFDYRGAANPKIVFWNHEKGYDKEQAISYICNSFSELLDMLHDDEG